jgi:hypothetical protein
MKSLRLGGELELPTSASNESDEYEDEVKVSLYGAEEPYVLDKLVDKVFWNTNSPH